LCKTFGWVARSMPRPRGSWRAASAPPLQPERWRLPADPRAAGRVAAAARDGAGGAGVDPRAGRRPPSGG
jgi:hypothetical protein